MKLKVLRYLTTMVAKASLTSRKQQMAEFVEFHRNHP
ncbi:hypothetical protein ALON55S_04970 [Alishewanella longhuensis]